jgi:hypothetical protein
VPAKGVPRIGFDTDTVNRIEGDGVVADEAFSLCVLDIAETPEEEDSAERKDGHAAAAKGRRGAAGAYLAVGEAEDAGNDERGEEEHPNDRFGDENEATGIPARVEGKERTHAVVVGPVKEDMAES